MYKFSEKTHEQLIAKWHENSDYVKAYDALEDAFAVLQVAIQARKEQKLSQTDIAEKMGLSRSAVCRLERGIIAGKMPTLSMLRRYAQALGKKVEIRLV